MFKKILLTLILFLGIALPLGEQCLVSADGNTIQINEALKHIESVKINGAPQAFTDLATGNTAETDVKDILRKIFKMGRNILGPLALAFLIYGGIRLGLSQNEEDNKKAIEVVVDAAIALVIVTAAPVIVDVFYQGSSADIDPKIAIVDVDKVGDIDIAAPWNGIEPGVYGQLTLITNFLMLTLIPVFIGVIIYFGTLHIFSFGDRDWLIKERKGMYWSVIGLVMVLLASSMVNVFIGNSDRAGNYSINYTKGLSEYIGFINYFLYFVGAVAVAIAIYCGYQLIVAGENEDETTKYKRQLGYVVIGIILIICSYVIVQTFLPSGDAAMVVPLS